MNRTDCTTPAAQSASVQTTAAHATVERLMVELRDALAACGQGPLRALIDSDGHCMVIEPAMGLPMSKTQRVWGVPVQMLREVYGPHPRPCDIIVEARR